MSAQSQALLVGGRRTPVGKYGGALSSVRPDDLAAPSLETDFEPNTVRNRVSAPTTSPTPPESLPGALVLSVSPSVV